MSSRTGIAMASLAVCRTCRGEGRVSKPPSRKARQRHKRLKANARGATSSVSSSSPSLSPSPQPQPQTPPRRWEPCAACQSTGLTTGIPLPAFPNNDPLRVAVVGGGIGGLALGAALKHRGISCTVYERDRSFSQRRQGYGLTMQQASKALKCFGITSSKHNNDNCNGNNLCLSLGITSTKHVVHTTDGSVVGEWGIRKWMPSPAKPNNNNNSSNNKPSSSSSKRQNIHISRQALRQELLNALLDHYCGEEEQRSTSGTSSTNASRVQWGCQLLDYKEMVDHVQLTFQKDNGDNDDDEGETFTAEADLLVGADGIRSVVRSIYIGDETTPLRYLECIVILGICPRAAIPSESPLLDGKTVFQTADGSTRLYAMPYSPTEYMWQLSFPMEEEDAKMMSHRGAEALKREALKRCGQWHDPIPQFLDATSVELVSGYPVYDRNILTADMLPSRRVTLLGDAAHPMSPFKGQGANQALLDSLSLARTLYRMESPNKDLAKALKEYTEEMLARSAVKVKASAEAAEFLHSEIAIQIGNVTRAGVAAARTSSSQYVSDASRGRKPGE